MNATNIKCLVLYIPDTYTTILLPAPSNQPSTLIIFNKKFPRKKNQLITYIFLFPWNEKKGSWIGIDLAQLVP